MDISSSIYRLRRLDNLAWSYLHYGFGGYTDALAARYRQINFLDYLALIGLPIFFILGILTVKRAQMEMEDYTSLDQIAMFIGRVTMLLIFLVVAVMMYEVVLRYVFERPTLWANELSLWMAGFVFILAGLRHATTKPYTHLSLYDMLPRNLQRTCDTISTFFILLFAFFLFMGAMARQRQNYCGGKRSNSV